MAFDIKESFYSGSAKGVVRGMHFQTPPFDHNKLVFPILGEIYDVAVDMRKESSTYGQHFGLHMNAETPQALWIPKGFAHGFQALTEGATLYYLLDSSYQPEADTGVLHDSVGVEWPLPIQSVSERDLSFMSFGDFKSPF